ncbi:MAG: D-glycero-beta-D-manno-heptose 1-phosphate adenylyltransferase [Actinomycetota bacterium]|nr:D-glycero-beta-D-manno-heptose 1-phosphate adenylyltransferase [Actinomycetota bacterium]
MNGPLVVLGDALLDIDVLGRADRLCPEAAAPVLEDVTERARPGGAALAALLAAGDGHEVILVTPLADDDPGRQLRRLLDGRMQVMSLPGGGPTSVKRRILASGHQVARLDSGGPGSGCGDVPEDLEALLSGAAALLVADYGRGVTAHPRLREMLTRAGKIRPLVWDPHPRGADPVSSARIVTPNQGEAALFAGRLPGDCASPTSALAAVAGHADALLRAWGVASVAVTMGARGALLSYGCGAPALMPAPPLGRVDTCGAGDRFASAVAVGLGEGLLTAEAVQYGVAAASSFLAAGGVATIGGVRPDVGAVTEPLELATAQNVATDAHGAELATAVRRRGGVVVATGGCFDLLHAGHIATLKDARGMGDCLIVCLNSDASVRRQKGDQRPLVPQGDRAQVLLALECVDSVVIFEEDTPAGVLEVLRPDIWVKGGDYVGTDLPEAEVLASWGGQAVVLPYLPGRSTTQLVHSAAAANPIE